MYPCTLLCLVYIHYLFKHNIIIFYSTCTATNVYVYSFSESTSTPPGTSTMAVTSPRPNGTDEVVTPSGTSTMRACPICEQPIVTFSN